MPEDSCPLYTLAAPLHCRGVGLHSGRDIEVEILPAVRAGIRFQRSDLPGSPEIPASLEHVVDTTHATRLQRGEAEVSTVEHLLAALYATGITHALIRLSGPEVPIFDGSSLPWCDLLDACGLAALPGHRPRYSLARPVCVQNGGGLVLGLPHPSFRLTVLVDFDYPPAGPQHLDLEVNGNSFRRELAPARTFTRPEWLEPLRARGLIRGGSTDNAIVLNPDGPSSPWRLPDELARHKALDAVGDLALMLSASAAALCAHVVAVKAGHSLHRQWMEAALREKAFIT